MYIARAYDGVRWVAHLETDSLDTALAQARGLMDLIASSPRDCRDMPPWLLIEVAKTDATGAIERQWVATSAGYHAVVGRNDGRLREAPSCML